MLNDMYALWESKNHAALASINDAPGGEFQSVTDQLLMDAFTLEREISVTPGGIGGARMKISIALQRMEERDECSEIDRDLLRSAISDLS